MWHLDLFLLYLNCLFVQPSQDFIKIPSNFKHINERKKIFLKLWKPFKITEKCRIPSWGLLTLSIPSLSLASLLFLRWETAAILNLSAVQWWSFWLMKFFNILLISCDGLILCLFVRLLICWAFLSGYVLLIFFWK